MALLRKCTLNRRGEHYRWKPLVFIITLTLTLFSIISTVMTNTETKTKEGNTIAENQPSVSSHSNSHFVSSSTSHSRFISHKTLVLYGQQVIYMCLHHFTSCESTPSENPFNAKKGVWYHFPIIGQLHDIWYFWCKGDIFISLDELSWNQQF